MKLCSHFSALKTQKVTNLIKNHRPICQNTLKHVPDKQNLWQCLSCPFVGCSRNNEAQCAEKHAFSESHFVTLSINDGQIFCYKCDKSLQEQIQLANGMEMECRQLDCLVQFVDKCQRFCDNHLKKSDQNSFQVQFLSGVNSKPKSTSQKQPYQQTSSSKFKMDLQQNQPPSTQHQTKLQKLNVFGLNNLGNTCFYNSILQCLYATPFLHRLYPSIDLTKSCEDNSAAQLVQAVYNDLEGDEISYNKPKVVPSPNINRRFQLLLSSGNNCKGTLNPSDMFDAVGAVKRSFRSMAQQDAQQLLRCLLDALNEGEITYLNINRMYLKAIELSGKRMKLTTIQNVFGCFLASRLHCLNCQKVSWNMDLCLDINIELSASKIPYVQVPSQQPIPVSEIHQEGLFYPASENKLPAFLKPFFSAEPLSKVNFFSCQHCKASKATKKLYIKDPPRNLTIVLKRFTNAGQKNNVDVSFPFELDLSGACVNPGNWMYNLYGVCVHQGGARGGHYIAYTKRENSWYYFSDSSYKVVQAEHAKSAQAYILFYELQ